MGVNRMTLNQPEAGAARDRRNRDFWNERSDAYQRDHGDQFAAQFDGVQWGVWSVPDAELGVLGEVADRDVLEVGTGAAHASAAVARQGARAVGIDISERQLAHAAKVVADAGDGVRLVQASAEALPFKAGSFDVVFSDHGAIALAQPELAVAEAARVLRGRGLLAVLVPSPFTQLAWSPQTGRLGTTLRRSYFELNVDAAEPGGRFPHQRGYGDWVALFGAAGFTVEDLIEVRPPDGATSTFGGGFADLEWARRFPAEIIWKVRKGPVRRRRTSTRQSAQAETAAEATADEQPELPEQTEQSEPAAEAPEQSGTPAEAPGAEPTGEESGQAAGD
jgi:SAM-dependent methyltransferase